MTRVRLVLVVVLLVAVAWPLSRAVEAASAPDEPAVCREMTPARMLEHPALAEEWAAALRSAQPDEIDRLRAMLAQIRAAHGCSGELSLPAPSGPTALPPGHPPVEGDALPPGHPPVEGDALPPGHPPVQSSPQEPIFEPPATFDT